MSASLVGSEMCIRDSPPYCGPPACRRWAACRYEQCGRRSAGRPTRARTPVSYTHLTLPTICSV
eukprot:2538297-Alexandrium_andersonii.AAC.1